MDAKECLKPKPKDIVESLMTFEGKETKSMKDKTGTMVEKVYLRYKCPNANCQVGVIAFLDKSGFKNPLSHLKVCYSRGLDSNAQEEKLLKMYYEIKGMQPNGNGTNGNGNGMDAMSPDAIPTPRPSTVLPFKEYKESTAGTGNMPTPKLGRISYVRRSSNTNADNDEEVSCTSPTGATGNVNGNGETVSATLSEGKKRGRQAFENDIPNVKDAEGAERDTFSKMKWELQLQHNETLRLRKVVSEQSTQLRKIKHEVDAQKKETQELKDILTVLMYDLNKERACRIRAHNK